MENFARSKGKGVPSKFPFFLFVLISVILSHRVAAEEIIRIGGTGTGTLLTRQLADAYSKLHPDIRVETVMPPMGSNGSLRALTAGAIQIAVVTFPTLYPAENKPGDAGENKSDPWVRTPLIFTGRDIAAGTGLTMDQVADIYSGHVTQWSNGNQIRLVTRTDRESDTRLLRAISPKMNEAVSSSVGRIGAPFAENDLDNQQLLEHTAGSFGAIALGQLMMSNSRLKPVALDGALPSAGSLQSGAYRIEKPLYLVTGKSVSPASLAFIQYLQSPAVLKEISRFGFIPLKQN